MGSEVAAPGLLSTDSLVGVLGLSSSVAVGSSQVGVSCIVRQIRYQSHQGSPSMQFYASFVKFIPSNCEWYILKLHFLVVYRYLYKAMLFNLFFF